MASTSERAPKDNQSLQQASVSSSSGSSSSKNKFAANATPMSPDKVSEMNMDTEGAPPKISKELIAARARELWELSGRQEGCDLKNWLQAEEDLRTRTTHNL